MASSYVNLRDYPQKSSVFSGFSSVICTGVAWSAHGHPQPLPAELVNADFFSLLGERIASGRDFAPDREGRAVLPAGKVRASRRRGAHRQIRHPGRAPPGPGLLLL